MSCSQYAYSKDKSSETALHELDGYGESSLNALTGGGALNNINPSAIITVLSNLGVNENIVMLIGNFLTKRRYSADLGVNKM